MIDRRINSLDIKAYSRGGHLGPAILLRRRRFPDSTGPYRGRVTSPDPADGRAPEPPPVPDDRIHGDSLHRDSLHGDSLHDGSVGRDTHRGSEPFGDPWLRPTLNAGPAAGAGSTPTTQTPRPGAAPAGRASARAGAARRPWWLVAGLGATLVAAGVAGLATWGPSTGGLWHSVDEQQTYHAPGGALTIRAGTHDVLVRGGGAAGTVEVSRHLSWGFGAGPPTASDAWTGSVLGVGADCHGSGCSADYVVTVPDSTDVTVATGSGDIALTGSLGAVTLRSVSGDIEASDLDAHRVSAQVDSGDVDLGLASAASPVGVSTGSGDVSVRLPRGTAYLVDVESGSGDSEVGVPTDPAGTRTVRVRTGSGDIEVDPR